MDNPRNSSFYSNAQKAKIETVLTRRRDAIISEIYNSFFSADDPERVSMFDILNRLMLLVQTAVMFVIVEYDEKEETILDKDYINFNQHPFHLDLIKEKITEAKKKGNFFEIFGVKDRRLIVLLANQDAASTHSNKYTFKPLSPIEEFDINDTNQVICYQLKKVLSKDVYEERFGVKFLNFLQHVVTECQPTKMESIYSQLPEKDFDDYTNLHRDFIRSLEREHEKLGLKYDGAVNQAYKKSEKSLDKIPEFGSDLEKNSNLKLPNFLFFVRNYSCDKEKRHEYYNYGLQILVCEKQEEAIKLYLKRLSEIENQKSRYTSESNFKAESKYKQIGLAVNEDFWIKIRNQEGIDSLIDILKYPFQPGSYSMADPVFMSGIMHFRAVSVDGGLHRSLYDYKENIPRYEDLKQYKKNEILRIVLVYYLFLGMARNKNDGDLSVMLCPVSIGGRVFGVMSYVTFKSNNTNENNEFVVQYSASWRQNYHMYISGHRRFKRNLRAYLWESYVVFISYVFSQEVRKFSNDKNSKISDFQSGLNKKFELLTRFFSFTCIRGIFKKSGNNGNVTSIFGSVDLEITHNIDKDHFFSVFGSPKNLDRFVSVDKIKRRIHDEFHLGKF